MVKTIFYTENAKMMHKVEEILNKEEEFEKEGNFLVVDGQKMKDNLKSCLKNNEIEDFSLITDAEIKGLLNEKITKSELNKINFDYSWMKNENFFLNFSGQFKIGRMLKKEVSFDFSLENIPSFFVSHCGNLFAFCKNKEAIFFANESLDRMFDVKLEEPIKTVKFSPSDQFAVLETESKCVIYDIFSFRRIYAFSIQNYAFYAQNGEEEICIANRKMRNLHTGKERVFESFVDTENGHFVEYFDQNERIKKIKTNFLEKSYNKLTSVTFFFTENRIYALLKKTVKEDQHQFIIESFFQEEITSTSLKKEVEECFFSDSYFVVSNRDYTIDFYKKTGFSFSLVKTVKKDGRCIISISKSTVIIYDTLNNTLEFYEKEQLKTVFTHNALSGISWSKSKLYVAAFTLSDKVGGMLQIFNCDGKLLFKKIYSRLTSFEWRNYRKPSKETEKELIMKYEDADIESESEENEMEVKKLLGEWKEYLTSKITQIN
ncbi:hypothetical protein NUSPORA_01835 [Nucleospora cyclopteri]